MTLVPDTPRLGLATKLNYGLGAMAAGVGGGAALPVIALYANQVLGIPPGLVGLSIMISVIADAVLDPVIGRWSDSVISPWGRRHPFMYAAALPTAVGFYFLWRPPAGLSVMGLFAFMLAMQTLVRVSISLYDVPSAALAPELAPDYHQRTGLISYRFFFGNLGWAVTAMLLYGVFLRKDASHPLGILNRAGYAQFGSLCAVVMFVVILVSALATHRNIPHFTRPPRRSLTLAQSLAELAVIFTNRPFMTLVLSGLISGVAGGVGSTLGGYFYLYFWELKPQMISWMAPIFMIAATAGVALAPPLARRFDKKPAMITLFAVSAAAGVVPIGLRLAGLMPPNGSALVLIILMADALFAGMLAVTGLVIIASMMSDVVEDVAVRTGVRSEGLLFSASGLLPKITAAIGAGVAGLMLAVVRFPVHAQPGTVDPEILRRLAWLWLPLGVVFQTAAIAVLFFYRLDEGAHDRNLASLKGVQSAEGATAPAPLVATADLSPI